MLREYRAQHASTGTKFEDMKAVYRTDLLGATLALNLSTHVIVANVAPSKASNFGYLEHAWAPVGAFTSLAFQPVTNNLYVAGRMKSSTPNEIRLTKLTFE